MALTKPKLSNINTDVVGFLDPITVLHQGATSPNTDVGFLFNRANGLVSNVAIYWSEANQSFVTAFTTNTGSTNSNIAISSYADLTIGNLLMVNGSILNVTGNINANVAASGTSYFKDISIVGNITYGSGVTTVTTNTVTGIGVGDVAIDNFDNATICSAKYLISTRNLNNSQSQSTEILLAQDGANVNIVTYAVNYTGTSQLMTFSANIYAGTVTVWASGTGSNNTVKLSRTAIPM